MTESLIEKLDYQATFDCVQCGYCLPVCPTYLAFNNEKHSPRGRINLVKLAAEEKIGISDMEDAINLCLGCRACETICPTNVRYGDILMSAVEVINENKKHPPVEKIIRTGAFKYVLGNKRMIRFLNRSLYLYQKSQADTVMSKTGALKAFPKYDQLNRAMPDIILSRRLTRNINPFRQQNLSIGFFQGCIMDAFFSRINDLAIKTLEHHDVQVTNIKSQTCCGALQHHAGEKDITLIHAKENIEAYEKYDFDYIVNTIGGCGATLKEYPKLFKEGTDWHYRAVKFSGKVRDISEILFNLELKLEKPIKRNAVYQPSCHMEHVQKVVDEPLKILSQIPGLNNMEMKNKSLCCGSAGVYNIIHYNESMQILDMKMKNIKAAEPELIITSNPGCHIQMQLGVEREGYGDKIEVKHLVEVVAESCGL